MKKIIATAALACLFSGSALATATISNTPAPSSTGVATNHSVTINVNDKYVPLTFTDKVTDAGALSEIGATDTKLVVSSQFTYQPGHTYILSNKNVTGGNASKLNIGFATTTAVPAGLDEKTSLVGSASAGDAYVLVATKGAGVLTKGSTIVTYTVTDYTS